MNDFIITPLAGALIGYFTNWLAIKMLFRPHTEKYLFGIRLPFTPGLMPKERYRLSKKIGETIAEHVLTGEMIKDTLLSEENMREIEHGLREFLRKPAARIISEKLSEVYERIAGQERGVLAYLPERSMDVVEKFIYENIPRLVTFIKDLPAEASEQLIELTGKVIDEAVGRLAAIFISRERVYEGIMSGLCAYLETEENRISFSQKLSGRIAEFLEKDARKIPWDANMVADITSRLTELLFGSGFLRSEAVRMGIAQALGGAISNIDVGKLVEEQINAMDVDMAEEIVISVVQRELRAITVVGGVLGFIIGLVPGILSLLGV